MQILHSASQGRTALLSTIRNILILFLFTLAACGGGGGGGSSTGSGTGGSGGTSGGSGGSGGSVTLAAMDHEITYDKVSDAMPAVAGMQVNTNFGAKHKNLEMVFNGNGAGMAVWTTVTTDTETEKVVYSVYNPVTDTWAPEQTLFVVTNITPPKTNYSLAASDNGFAITWGVNSVYSVTSGNQQVWEDYNYAKIYSGGSWSRAYLLNSTASPTYLSSPIVNSNGNGFLFVWRENFNLVSRVWNNGGFSATSTAYSGGSIGIDDVELISNGSDYMLKAEHGISYISRYMVAVRYSNGSWGTAATTQSNPGTITYSDIATDGSGYMMSWVQSGSTYYRAFANNSWSSMSAISNGPSGNHQLVSDSNNYLMSWINSSRLNVKTYSGGNWGATELPDSITGSISSVGVTPTTAGYDFALRVYDSGQSVYDLYLLHYNGGASGTDVLADQLNFSITDQSIAFGDGKSWLAWNQFDASDMQLKLRPYQGTTPLMAEQSLNQNLHSAGVTSGKSIVTPMGVKVVAWSQTYFDATGTERFAAFARVDDNTGSLGSIVHIRDYARVRDIVKIGESVIVLLSVSDGISAIEYINGSWTTVTTLTSSYVYDWDYRIANNRLMLVWENVNDMRAAVFESGGWSSVTKIDAPSTNNGYFEMDDNGEDFMVTWMQFLATNTTVTPNTNPRNINARFYDASLGSWSAISLLQNYESTVGGVSPRITSDGNSFLIAWSRADTTSSNSDTSLYTSICDAAGSCSASALTENQTGSVASIDMASNGSNYLVVFANSGQYYDVMHNGTAWSTPSLTTINGGIIKLLPDGSDYLAIWSSYTNPTYVSRYSGGWGSAQQIINTSLSYYSTTMKSIATDTGYAFTWTTPKPGAFYQIDDLYMTSWDGASWSSAQQINTGKFDVRSYQMDYISGQLHLSWVQAHEAANDEAAPALWEASF